MFGRKNKKQAQARPVEDQSPHGTGADPDGEISESWTLLPYEEARTRLGELKSRAHASWRPAAQDALQRELREVALLLASMDAPDNAVQLLVRASKIRRTTPSCSRPASTSSTPDLALSLSDPWRRR